MKAYLLYKDRDFSLHREPGWNEEALVQDLGLNTLYQSMAHGDAFILEVVKRVVVVSSVEPDEIAWRQAMLSDCILNEDVIRQLYAIALEAIETERKSYYSFFTASPGSVLHGSRKLIQQFIGVLKNLRNLADLQAANFQSEGFAQFFSMSQREFADDYISTVQRCLKELSSTEAY